MAAQASGRRPREEQDAAVARSGQAARSRLLSRDHLDVVDDALVRGTAARVPDRRGEDDVEAARPARAGANHSNDDVVPIDENGVPKPDKWTHGKLFHWDPFCGHTQTPDPPTHRRRRP